MIAYGHIGCQFIILLQAVGPVAVCSLHVHSFLLFFFSTIMAAAYKLYILSNLPTYRNAMVKK